MPRAASVGGAVQATEFDGVFGEETIELFLATSYDQFADRAKFNHFLPLIVERFARRRRHHHGLRATPAPCTPASGTTTGNSKTLPVSTPPPSAPSATKSESAWNT